MYKVDFNSPCHVHFMGIGGISMSGLAEILLGRGFTVSGSDRERSDLTSHLEAMGAKISYPQAFENITDDIDFIVYTGAIHEDNPEYIAAKASNKPMLKRAELLGQIMEHFKQSIAVSGTHGKTTTTSMISEILLTADYDPTISVGAIFKTIQSNVRVGHSDYFVTEACEYTDSYLALFPKYNIILNVDAEHLDYFKTLDNLRASFKKFAENTAADGALFINYSIPDRDYFTKDLKCKVYTFGLDTNADIYAKDISYNEIGHPTFTPVVNGTAYEPVTLGVPGEHNVSNSLSVIGTMLEMGLPFDMIKEGLTRFHGADRRFQLKGRLSNGATVVDDYAHHPTEIRASLKAALNTPHNRIIVAFQPHTYSRTRAFLDDFAEALSLADVIVMADIYAAREENIYNVSSNDIHKKLLEMGKESYYFHDFSDIEEFLKKNSMNGDLLITMGAGDITNIGDALVR